MEEVAPRRAGGRWALLLLGLLAFLVVGSGTVLVILGRGWTSAPDVPEEVITPVPAPGPGAADRSPGEATGEAPPPAQPTPAPDKPET